ncbi:MAG: exo-alpha-sialidase [Actinomycetota bacterium]|nr:exo-alpha-sialidase [Actinomycetota bacterium]
MRIAIGTRKGLWTAKGGADGWEVSQPLKAMAEFSSVAWMPRGAGDPPRLLAGARSWFWGPSVLFSDDDGVTWSDPEHRAIAFPPDAGVAIERIWNLTPDPRQADVVWAGCEPHSLWRSSDGGSEFTLNAGLWEHPHRPEWMPGAGGAAIHTIAPRPDGSMVVAMSTGGVYRSADSDSGWVPANRGIRVDFQPEEYPEFNQCVHRIAVDGGDPSRVYAQNHGGVYRSDDSGDAWQPIMEGLPKDFGFVVLAHPSQGGTAWVIPIDAETMFPPEGRLRLWRTDDAGATWAETGDGLPDGHYASVMRDSAHVIEHDGDAAIAFGTRNGCVFASLDGGRTFTEVVSGLPDVLSVRISP